MNQPDQNTPVKEPVRPNIPVGEALELPEDIGWGMWDIAVRARDREEVVSACRGNHLQKSC